MDRENSQKFANKTFEWTCNSSKPVFPIDYSQRNLATLLNEDPRKINNYNLFKDNVLKEQFHNSTADKEKSQPDREKNAAISFPIESIPFFKCFYQLTTDPKYYPAFSSKSNDIPQDVMNDFILDLCRNLRDEVKGNQIPGNKYCRQSLYKNETFQSQALADLWAQEVTSRYEHLLDIARTTEPLAQQNALIRCILFLDQNILELGYQKQIPENQPNLRKMLSCLLQRKQVKQNSSYASYYVENIPFSTTTDNATTLHEAFSVLNYTHKQSSKKSAKKPSPGLMVAARQAYLSKLDDNSTSSDFEANYNSIAEYLQFQNDPKNQELIAQLVRNRCKQYCISILDQCRLTPDSLMPPILEPYTSLEYVAQLTDCLVNAALCPDCNYYKPTIQLLTCLHMAKYVHDRDLYHTQVVLKEINRDINPIEAACPTVTSRDNPTYQEALQFSGLFADAWKRLYGTDVFSPDTHCVVSLNDAAQKIYQDGLRTAQYFGRENEFFPYSLEDVKGMLNSYEKIVSHPSRFYAYGNLLTFAPQLLTFVLVAVFYCIVESKVPFIIKDLQHLFPSHSA